ncbi:hypothetical protein RAS2_16520 [Phycisphaerae bacterium RAS2]|nr:hypothetical protein RAS2_16520 [Phycisphaerae bacterium RAS2]
MAWLTVISGPELGTTHEIHKLIPDGDGPVCCIGRNIVSPVRQLSLDYDLYISRKKLGHAIVSKADGQFILTRGTTLNPVWLIRDQNVFELEDEGASISMGGTLLFSCGQSAILFLDVEAHPPEEMLRELRRGYGETISSLNKRHPKKLREMTTVGKLAPLEESAILRGLWPHVRTTLVKNGYEHLLSDN